MASRSARARARQNSTSCVCQAAEALLADQRSTGDEGDKAVGEHVADVDEPVEGVDEPLGSGESISWSVKSYTRRTVPSNSKITSDPTHSQINE